MNSTPNASSTEPQQPAQQHQTLPLTYDPASIHQIAKTLLATSNSIPPPASNNNNTTTTTTTTTSGSNITTTAEPDGDAAAAAELALVRSPDVKPNVHLHQIHEQATTSAPVAAAAAAQTSAPGGIVRGIIRYRECQRNHAANIGQVAHDGCGEFIPPPGADPSYLDPDSLKCGACGCHRNFHRLEDPAELLCDNCNGSRRRESKVLSVRIGGVTPVSGGGGGGVEMMTPVNQGGSVGSAQKRFRTKFTTEQKTKMFDYATRVGWKMSKENEEEVQRFCTDVGVRRQVFKIWMHNNKHSMGKKTV